MSTLKAMRKVAGSLGIWRLVVYLKEKAQLESPSRSSTQYDSEAAKRVIPKITDRYITMVNFAKRHGSDLMIAVQPDIYTKKELVTEEEAGVWQRFNDGWKDIDDTFGKYRADLVHDLNTHLAAKQTQVLDLGGVFDSVNEPVFLDACHLNDQGYRVIATALRDAIKSSYRPLAPNMQPHQGERSGGG